MWTVKISAQASRFYAALQVKEQRRLAAAFDALQQEPRGGKPLKGELKGYWSYRVGVYRVIYTIEASEVVVYVLRIQHRKEVYERLRG
jgi:mRNA interferase RelE/StbE